MHGPLLLWLYLASLACATVAATALWSYLDRAGKVLGIIIFATLLVELLRVSLNSGPLLIKSLILLLVSIGEILGFGLLYLLTIHAGLLRRKMLMLSLLLALLILGNIYILQPMPHVQTNLYLLENVFLTAIAIHALYYVSVSSLTQKLLSTPSFWFWAMILIYQCSTLGFWGSVQLLMTQPESVQRTVADIQVIINIIQYTGMAYGLTLYRPKKHKL